MLKEGKSGKVSNYLVGWKHDGDFQSTYIQALTAQQAVNFVRQYSAPDGAKIVEVAKVVNNWK